MELALLKQFGDEIWITDGPIVTVLGFRYPTRTAVIRLSDGSLFIWSPTRLTDSLRGELDALGEVRRLIAPNSNHHLFLAEWKSAYPKAALYAPPGLRAKRKDIAFDADLGNEPGAAWAGEIDQTWMEGNLIMTEVVFFHVKSGTVLFTDLIQQFPDDWFSGWRAVAARMDFMVAPEASVPRKFRIAFINRRAARAGLARILAWPAQKVLIAHGEPICEDGKAFIRRAFRWLTP